MNLFTKQKETHIVQAAFNCRFETLLFTNTLISPKVLSS